MDNLEELYDIYAKDLFSYLYSLTRDPFWAEDLLQETFLKAITSVSRFEGRSSIKTWLFGIARNLWYQSLSKISRSSNLCEKLSLYIKTDDSLEKTFITNETLQRVQQLLTEKEDKVRSIVQMRLDGYSYYEISQALGIRENSARVADFRVKCWLRDRLKKEGLL